MDTSWVPFLLCLLLVAVVFFVGVWYFMSMSHYSWRLLKPGDTYIVNGSRYVFPNVDTYGPTFLLKDKYINELRGLVTKVGTTLRRMQIEWWVTGGTLLGYEMYKTIPFPSDDDVDLGVDYRHREVLFSAKFADEARKEGLRVLFLRGASTKRADRTGACVRCQIDGHASTLDIFFWKVTQNGDKVIKIDGWSDGNDVFNVKEQFDIADVYPIQNDVAFDNLQIGLPRNPRNLLIKQYGPKVFERTIARSLFVSHRSPFVLLQAIWSSNPPG